MKAKYFGINPISGEINQNVPKKIVYYKQFEKTNKKIKFCCKGNFQLPTNFAWIFVLLFIFLYLCFLILFYLPHVSILEKCSIRENR